MRWAVTIDVGQRRGLDVFDGRIEAETHVRASSRHIHISCGIDGQGACKVKGASRIVIASDPFRVPQGAVFQRGKIVDQVRPSAFAGHVDIPRRVNRNVGCKI